MKNHGECYIKNKNNTKKKLTEEAAEKITKIVFGC
jgi:hypothetical protein